MAAMKSLLLTGGSGFFGQSILDAYRRGLLVPLEIGRVVALARHATRLRDEAPELCGAGVELVDADVLQLDSVFGADVVIHAAASSDARRYRSDPDGQARIIEEGTRRVCEAVLRARHAPQFLHVSSGAVYGRQPPGVVALAEDAVAVSDGAAGKEVYAPAKRAAEEVVRDFGQASRASVRIARCFAFVGPYLPRDQHFAIGNFIGNALRGQPVEVRARHPVFRSYLHSDDLVVWLLRIATAEGKGGDVFNVGSDEAVEIRDLASIVADIAGVPVSLPESHGESGEAAPADRYVPDVGKARRELGLTVTIPLRDAVERTLRAVAGATPRRAAPSLRVAAGMPR
jgi:dTDP-glucose 4,6-dehydratase